jgi:hypothetical protein
MRPVFDDAGESIKQTIVTHTILIDYSDGGDNRQLQVAMDASDIAELRRLCERAEVKAASLRSVLKDMPWPVSIPPN